MFVLKGVNPVLDILEMSRCHMEACGPSAPVALYSCLWDPCELYLGSS